MTAPLYPSRCCAVSVKQRTYTTRYQLSTTEVGGLTAPLNLPIQFSATAHPTLERKEVETRGERSIAAAASALTATAPPLKGKEGSRLSSAFHRS